MYKCGDCHFWGGFDEIVVARESEHHPFGDSTAEETFIYWHCPKCHSEDVTGWHQEG